MVHVVVTPRARATYATRHMTIACQPLTRTVMLQHELQATANTRNTCACAHSDHDPIPPLGALGGMLREAELEKRRADATAERGKPVPVPMHDRVGRCELSSATAQVP